MKTSHLGLSGLRSLTLCITSDCGSLHLSPYAAGGIVVGYLYTVQICVSEIVVLKSRMVNG